MAQSFTNTMALEHYASVIGPLHEKDRQGKCERRQQLVAIFTIVLALGGVLLGLG